MRNIATFVLGSIFMMGCPEPKPKDTDIHVDETDTSDALLFDRNQILSAVKPALIEQTKSVLKSISAKGL